MMPHSRSIMTGAVAVAACPKPTGDEPGKCLPLPAASRGALVAAAEVFAHVGPEIIEAAHQ